MCGNLCQQYVMIIPTTNLDDLPITHYIFITIFVNLRLSLVSK